MAEREPDHKVEFVRDDKEKKWKTIPPKLGRRSEEDKPVKKGDWILWKAPEGSKDKEVILFFPDETIFGTNHVKFPFGEEITLEVKRIGRKEPDTQKLEENLYAAYCPKGFAEGESNPIIIIEE